MEHSRRRSPQSLVSSSTPTTYWPFVMSSDDPALLFLKLGTVIIMRAGRGKKFFFFFLFFFYFPLLSQGTIILIRFTFHMSHTARSDYGLIRITIIDSMQFAQSLAVGRRVSFDRHDSPCTCHAFYYASPARVSPGYALWRYASRQRANYVQPRNSILQDCTRV